jgi:hypothetical protein
MVAGMIEQWNPAFIKQLPLFDILTNAYNANWRTKTTWPTISEYNQHLAKFASAISNYNGQPIQFVQQTQKSQDLIYGYEPSIYLRGEVLTRANNWHDFFNMLVWLTFPNIKANINYWQYNLLQQRWPKQKQRTPLENKLTHLDENGVIVVSSNPYLSELLQAHRWQELFCQHRAAVQKEMRFFIVGHALYEKALNPYIGLTGCAIILTRPFNFFAGTLAQQLLAIDQQVSEWLLQPTNLANWAKLTPVPILGVPGWWAANEDFSFYENKKYFRVKRVGV